MTEAHGHASEPGDGLSPPGAWLTFDLSGWARLSILDRDERVRRYVRAQMDPYVPVPAPALGAEPDVTLEASGHLLSDRFVDVQNPAGDDVITASDGRSGYVLRNGFACQLPELCGNKAARLAYEPGFPLSHVFGSLIRPTLQIGLLEREAVAVHASSVELNGSGIVIAGWSESGKTETALAFAEGGARFVSDKWTIVGSDRTIAAFPISVGVRRWLLGYLPRFRASLPAAARGQLLAAGFAAALSRPLRSRRPAGRLGGLAIGALEHAVQLADRAALRPSQIRQALGDSDRSWTSSLATVALLRTVPGSKVVAEDADPGWAARRLARSAAFERRPFFDLYERHRFAFPNRDAGFGQEVVRREERLLEELLAGARVLDVRAPFPVDPRRVADAVARCL